MREEPMEQSGWYLYALAESSAAPELENLVGVAGPERGPEVHAEAFAEAPFLVVASPFDGARVRPERRNIARHHAVLQALLEQRVAFLPFAFGMLAGSRAAVVAVIQGNRAMLDAEFARLGRCVEMGVRVLWDVPNIFDYFVFHNPELAEMRDRLLRRPGGPTRDDQILLGQTFESVLNQTRERHQAMVTRALEPHVLEVHTKAPRDEKSIVNLTCLIDRDGTQDFEKALFEAAALFDDHHKFDFDGPWPPFHFVRVSIEGSQAPAVGRSERVPAR
jgi:hypothetical protein